MLFYVHDCIETFPDRSYKHGSLELTHSRHRGAHVYPPRGDRLDILHVSVPVCDSRRRIDGFDVIGLSGGGDSLRSFIGQNNPVAERSGDFFKGLLLRFAGRMSQISVSVP